jgi:hypothetical protein
MQRALVVGIAILVAGSSSIALAQQNYDYQRPAYGQYGYGSPLGAYGTPSPGNPVAPYPQGYGAPTAPSHSTPGQAAGTVAGQAATKAWTAGAAVGGATGSMTGTPQPGVGDPVQLWYGTTPAQPSYGSYQQPGYGAAFPPAAVGGYPAR